jgi:hypothetical protein
VPPPTLATPICLEGARAMSHVTQHSTDSARYAKCVEVSKRIRWETDRDVIRGRQFDFDKTFLPDGLSKAAQLPFLSASEKRLFSQVQGRTYANMFALVERFIGAKVLELSRGHWLGDQVALEALVRLTDEELKHQAMFRRLETMMAPGMPAGYRFLPQPNEVAQAVLAASTWAVLALVCDIELFSQAHYRSSIEPETQIDPLWKDVFLFHWKEESQHAILDEMEWLGENEKISPAHGQPNRSQDMSYIDGFVIAVPTANKQKFIEHARHFDALFLELGAIRVIEAGATTCPTARSPTSAARCRPRPRRRWPFRGSSGRTRPRATPA